jgi:hypothetical protein
MGDFYLVIEKDLTVRSGKLGVENMWMKLKGGGKTPHTS